MFHPRRRHGGRWHSRLDPDTLRVGCVHLAGTVLPATLWAAAVISRWCARMQPNPTLPLMTQVNVLVIFYISFCVHLTSSASLHALGRSRHLAPVRPPCARSG